MARTAAEHCKIVLGGILPSDRSRLEVATRHLTAEHFPDQLLRNFFTILQRFYDAMGSVLSMSALEDMLRESKADVGTVRAYSEMYDLLTKMPVEDVEFKWSLEQVRELAAEKATSEALVQAMEILNRGVVDEKGNTFSGHRDSRVHAFQKFSEIDKNLLMQDSPEGDMSQEGDQMLADYAERQKRMRDGSADGVLFGISDLDSKLGGGLQNAELCLIAGYSSSGKTSLLVQLAWHAAVMQGLNFVFFTTETLRDQIKRKMLARHSRHDMFGIPEGINTRDLKRGTLPEIQREKMMEVHDDLIRNRNYGKKYIAQVPRGASITTIEASLHRLQRSFPIHLVLVDYFALLRSDRKRNSDREEYNSIIKEGKSIAATFDDGRGVPVVSPWQVNRTWRDTAAKMGYYSTMALAETAEASNSSDVIISLLEPEDNDSRYAELRGQILKNRDGETARDLLINVDYATCTFSGNKQDSSMDFLTGL